MRVGATTRVCQPPPPRPRIRRRHIFCKKRQQRILHARHQAPPPSLLRKSEVNERNRSIERERERLFSCASRPQWPITKEKEKRERESRSTLEEGLSLTLGAALLLLFFTSNASSNPQRVTMETRRKKERKEEAKPPRSQRKNAQKRPKSWGPHVFRSSVVSLSVCHSSRSRRFAHAS